MSNYTVNSSWTNEGTENTPYEESSGYDSGTTTVTVSSVTADEGYVLIETGKTTTDNPEAQLEIGQKNSGETFWDFWGPDKTTVLDVYLDNGDGTFTIQSGASVTIS